MGGHAKLPRNGAEETEASGVTDAVELDVALEVAVAETDDKYDDEKDVDTEIDGGGVNCSPRRSSAALVASCSRSRLSSRAASAPASARNGCVQPEAGDRAALLAHAVHAGGASRGLTHCEQHTGAVVSVQPGAAYSNGLVQATQPEAVDRAMLLLHTVHSGDLSRGLGHVADAQPAARINEGLAHAVQ